MQHEGEIGILNVGAGDTKLSFDPANPADVAVASAAVTEMLQRGFAILVEVDRDDDGPIYRRAKGFDPETNEYIIVGAPGDTDDGPKKSKSRKARAKKTTTRKPAAKSKAIAVARSAGG